MSNRPARLHRLIFPILLWWSVLYSARGSIFTVTNTLDSGNGSLRQAITSANSVGGSNSITFQIPGTPPFTLTPASVYPPISSPITIDGSTQPGYSGIPAIQINATNIGSGNDALTLAGGNSSVIGLAIFNSRHDGIRISGLASNTISGCYLGSDYTGTNFLGNLEAGVYIYRSSGNLIGSLTTNRNLISGNSYGVFIDGGASPFLGSNNVVEGCYIGVTRSGASPAGNTNQGVYISQSPGNLIGGIQTGAGNVISGNRSVGIFILGSASSNNVIVGNSIGTDATGSFSISNKANGILIYGCSYNQIGLTNPAVGNLISGNLSSGIYLINNGTTNATGNSIYNNYIGTDAAGTHAIGNGTNGVIITGCSGNVIGGPRALAGNLISGNFQNGIELIGAASNNIVQGNLIGTAVNGTNALPNTFNGLDIVWSTGNLVGGTNPTTGNLLSGNLQSGVYLQATGMGSNTLQGNYIGTDLAGHLSVSNQMNGIWIESASNLIGGSSSLARNLISGNFQSGLFLTGTGAVGNVVAGNYIGTDRTGATNVGNGFNGYFSGIYLTNAAKNQLGLPGAGNLISGNGDKGISLNGALTTQNRFQGNYIGTDKNGVYALPNANVGIYISGAPTNYVGGTNSGSGNLISGSLADGIYISAANGQVIQGNIIGPQSDGVTKLGNIWHGIELINNSSYCLIGGTNPAADNRIAYELTAQYDGVRIRSGSVGNQILRNSFFSNGGNDPLGLAITIGNVGVTTNGLPVFTSALTDGRRLYLSGSLHNTPNDTFLLQVYANLVTNLSGYGEGLIWLGSTNITTDASGLANLSILLNTNVPVGEYLSTTVTDSTNNTSEFSADIPVASVPPLVTKTYSVQGTITSNYNATTVIVTNLLTGKTHTNPAGWTFSTNYQSQFYLTIPTNLPAYTLLQSTSLLSGAAWSAVTNQPTLVSNQYRFYLSNSNHARQFFQLSVP